MAINNARGLQPLSLTTAQRGALSGNQRPTGLMVYDTDLNDVMMWNGTVWMVIGSVPGTMVFLGTIDATTTAPPLGSYENGQFYINTTAGTAVSGWTGIAGSTIGASDRLVFDGTNWANYPVGSIPTLQAVTDAGDETDNTITAAGFTTAGTVSANNVAASVNATVGDDITLTASTGKIVSSSTASTDGDSTVTTKDYVDGLQLWSRTGTVLSPATANDKVTSGATVAADPDATLTTKGYVDTAVSGVNVGVTQITAGTNVSISPTGGTGNVTINASGNGLLLTNGDNDSTGAQRFQAGIQLGTSGTSGTGTLTSETLDDYEQGDWTPIPQMDTAVLGGVTNPTVGSPTYTGRYTKIGNLVHLELRTNFNTGDISPQAGDRVIFNGLPFAPKAQWGVRAAGTSFVYKAIAAGRYALGAGTVNQDATVDMLLFYRIGNLAYDNQMTIFCTYEVD